MKKKNLATIATVLAAVLILSQNQTVQAQTAPPGLPAHNSVATFNTPTNALVWDSEMKVITVNEGTDQGHLFYAFTNQTTAPVVFTNVHPGCGCTTADFPVPQTIAPGGTGRIPITINLRGKTGTLFKKITVTTDESVKTLNFRVNILPAPKQKATAEERANMIKVATADRQAVFKNQCATCHAKNGEGQYGGVLFAADCGICHQGPDRPATTPDLLTLKTPSTVDYWRAQITHGKPGTLMPAFAIAEGGPLTDIQINTLVQYLAAISKSSQ